MEIVNLIDELLDLTGLDPADEVPDNVRSSLGYGGLLF